MARHRAEDAGNHSRSSSGRGPGGRPRLLGARVWVMRGIEMQDDPGDLTPIRAFRIGIEKAQIGDEVLLVIAGEDVASWGQHPLLADRAGAA